MHTLIVMRHAEAAGSPAGGGDRDRPLTTAGAATARDMGRLLSERGFRPDAACVSPARRTRQTWDFASESFGDVDVDCAESLYDAGAPALRRAVEAAEGRCGAFMLVAHNPGVHQLVLDLLTESAAPPSEMDRFQRGFPPGAAAVFEVDAAGRSRLQGFWTGEEAITA